MKLLRFRWTRRCKAMIPVSPRSPFRLLREYHRDLARHLHLILRVQCSLIRGMDQHSMSDRRETLYPCLEMSARPDLADNGLPVLQHLHRPAGLIHRRVTMHTLARNAQRKLET
jgi:hypothetical protein